MIFFNHENLIYILCGIFSFLVPFIFRKSSPMALLMTITSAILFIVLLFFEDGWHWFTVAKRCSVFFPIILWSYHHYSLDRGGIGFGKWMAGICNIVLFLNIFEGGLYDFLSGSKINGALVIIYSLTALSLRWEYDKETGVFGFTNTLWVWTYNFLLAYIFVFSSLPGFNMVLLLVAMIGSFGNIHNWMWYRAYSLWFFLILHTFFSTQTKMLLKGFFLDATQSRVDELWLVVNTILLSMLLFRIFRQFRLGRIVNT